MSDSNTTVRNFSASRLITNHDDTMKYQCIVESKDTLEVMLGVSGQAVRLMTKYTEQATEAILLDREAVLKLSAELAALAEVMLPFVHPPSTQK